jgi:hypothetical protein
MRVLIRWSISIHLVFLSAICSSAVAQEQQPPPTVKRVVESQIAINSALTIVVENLDKWMQQPGHDYQKFVLHMDGYPLKSLKPALMDVKNETGAVEKALRFDLWRDGERESWTELFSRRRPGEFTNRNVLITLQHGENPIPGQTEVNLKVIDWKRFWLFISLSVAFVAACGFLCLKTDMIRDPGPGPSGINSRGKPVRKAYSLARAQMAFWFFVVVISYAFIWVATGYQSNLPASVLALIGISAATGLGAAVVDSTKKTDQENLLRNFQEKKQAGEAEVDKLVAEIAVLNAAITAEPPPLDIDQKKSELAEKQGQLAARQTENVQTSQQAVKISSTLQPTQSNGFIRDILSDDGGVSFHRLQIAGWSVVLILIFIVSVYDVLAMPDFDTTLLALMGISGGTYLGFKLPNQQG